MRVRSVAACYDSLVEGLEVNTTTSTAICSLEPLGQAEINVTLELTVLIPGLNSRLRASLTVGCIGFLLVLALARVIPRDCYSCRARARTMYVARVSQLTVCQKSRKIYKFES